MKKLLCLIVLLSMLTGCAAKEEIHTQDDMVIIALLDTGISTTAIDSACLLQGYNYVTDSTDTEDRINHGTAVASAIVGCEQAGVIGAAPDVKLVPMVVLDKNGEKESVSAEKLAQVIRDSVDVYHADIINVSLGIKKDIPELQKAVEYAEKKGVLIVSAVGNSDDDEAPYYPAAYDSVLAVGSHNEDMEVSGFSQKNGTVDLLASGEDVWLASRNGKTYGSRGTSYATGYVSAAAAQLLSRDSTLTPEALRSALREAAEDIGEPGYDAESGWGILRIPDSN